MRIIGLIKERIGRSILARSTSGSVDLRKLRFLPASVTMPLRRVVLDPLPKMAETRAAAPVLAFATAFGRTVWLVTGYDQARAVLADAASYSNDLGKFVSQDGREAAEQIGGLGMTDPPLHTDLRRYLTPEFTKRRLARLQPRIEEIVSARLDAMEAAGPYVDLVGEFAFPVPFEVICELLGLADTDRARFRGLGAARFDLMKGGVGVFGAAADTREFLIEAVAKQRIEPGDGLIGALLAEHGDELDDVTLGGLADGIFLGGYETSASMLALSACLLAQSPPAVAMLRDGPEEVDQVVEELLRHLSVVQVAFLRFARDEVQLGGQTIATGDWVAVSLLGANRDPGLTADPDGFDPTRTPTPHLGFGHGLHRCIGAELARMELRCALSGLAQRFPDLEVATEVERLKFRKLSAVYGVEALPVRLYGAERTVPDAASTGAR